MSHSQAVISEINTPRTQGLVKMLVRSLPAALKKFSPVVAWHNPVMFVVWVGALFLTVQGTAQLVFPADMSLHGATAVPVYFTWIIAVWLWVTVLFANMAEAVSESRGKAQADALRKTRTTTPARRVHGYDAVRDPDVQITPAIEIPSSDLQRGDVVIVSEGEVIPGDGDIISGVASVDEAAITGESAPVIREAGMDRMVQHNVLATSGRAIEAAGDITTLLLDKTGTITYGNRQAVSFHALRGVEHDTMVMNAALSSLFDSTPEGKSIVVLARQEGHDPQLAQEATPVPFTAQTRMSGLDLPDGLRIRKGASSTITAWIEHEHGHPSQESLDELDTQVEAVATTGGTPLAVAEQHSDGQIVVLGVVELKDIVKTGLQQRFDDLRKMGIRTIMVTGDNPLTAKAIAAEAGVDDFIAEAKPEDKLAYIKAEQAKGQLVAMTGDGTNDAPALAQSDVGVAMNSGTSAAKEAGNMVDLDSDPTKLIDIVRIGKQLLITRGSLTTFSIANDIAKYFAIIPAMFMYKFPGLATLNIMGLHSLLSAVLSQTPMSPIPVSPEPMPAHNGCEYRGMQYSTMQYSTMQYSTMQYSTMRYHGMPQLTRPGNRR